MPRSSSNPGTDLTIELGHKSSWKSDPCADSVSIRIDELLRMCAESEGNALSYPTHHHYVTYAWIQSLGACTAPIFLLKKGSRAPVGILQLRLEIADLISNAELDVKTANEDIKQLMKMRAGSTTIAAIADGISQLSTEDDLYKSIGTFLSKLDVFVGFVDEISKVSFI